MAVSRTTAEPPPAGLFRLRQDGSLAAAAALAYLATSGGFVFRWPTIAGGLLVGLVTGARRGSALRIGLLTAGVVLVLALILPPWQIGETGSQPLLIEITFALIAGVVAGSTAWLRSRIAGRHQYFVDVAVVLSIIVVMWISTISLASYQPGPTTPSLMQQLMIDPQPGTYTVDPDVYQHTYFRMRSGAGYYAAMREALLGDANAANPTALATKFREPALFWLWAALPSPSDIVPAFLVLASVGLVAAWSATRDALRGSGNAVLGALLIAAYLTFVGSTRYIAATESWAMMIGLFALAFFVRAAVREDSRWYWGAALSAAAAALTREHFVVLLFVLAASALVPAAFKRKAMPTLTDSAPWLVGLAVFVAGFALHVSATGAPLFGRELAQAYSGGGLSSLATSMTFGFVLFKLPGAIPYILLALGIAGSSTTQPLGVRLALCGNVIVMLVVLAMNGNIASGPAIHRVGYWGAMLTPYVMAAVPVGIATLEGRQACQAEAIAHVPPSQHKKPRRKR